MGEKKLNYLLYRFGLGAKSKDYHFGKMTHNHKDTIVHPEGRA
jgi:hypothetical protein